MKSLTTLVLAGALGAPALMAQTCNPHIRRSAPDDRYRVNAVQGTVLDTKTGLTWKRCVEGRYGADCGSGYLATMNWGAALSHAANSTSAGFKDWRLPNSKELVSLVEVACYRPAINGNVFPNDPSTVVWASSPNAGSAYYAWRVDSFIGSSSVELRTTKYPVRLVRGGQ